MGAAETLFGEKCDLDRRRQPGRGSSLDALIAAWRTILPSSTHPYDLDPAEKGLLARACPHFGGGSEGLPVALAAPYLYTLTGVRKLAHLLTWRSAKSAEMTHDDLIDAAGNPPAWLPLEHHATGPVRSFRQFTWWTTWDIVAAGQPFIAGRRLGLLDSWIAELGLILRWKVDLTAAKIQQPTCCDAFDGPVFESMPDSHSSGRTIDLNSDPFGAGEPEFAVTALPVEQISVYPVRIGPELRRGVLPPLPEDDDTWDRLAAYYRALP
jgi:hypothetical protein